jgi:excisionase family DNA binding protein
MTLPAFRPQWLDSSEREHMFNLHPVRSKQVPLMALAIVYRHPSAEGEAIGILEHLERIVGQPDTLPSTSDVGSIRRMNMPTQIGKTIYLTVKEAVVLMGCTDAWIRMLCRDGKLEGAIRHGQRSWLIPQAAAKAARQNLTSRSLGKKADS